MDKTVEQIIIWIKENWYTPYCGLLIFVLSLLIGVILFGKSISLLQLLITAICGIIFVLIWLNSRKLPTCSRKKIGFVVAITTENKEQYMRLKSDFVDCVRDLIRKDHFHVVVFPEYYAREVIESRDFGWYLEKAKGTFMLIGRCRRRNIKGMDTIVLDLEGGVHHRPIPKSISKRIAREFRFLLPRRIRVPKADEFAAFEFTSQYITIVARYIVGLASYLSYDLGTSFKLFSSLYTDLQSIETDLHTLVNIKQKLPNLLGSALREIAVDYYEIYRNNQDPTALEKVKSYLDKAQEVCPNHYRCHLLRATYYFESNRNIAKAKEEIDECKDEADASWLYSLAFLNAYSGDMLSAIDNYRKAFKRPCGRSIPLNVEYFIREVIKKEPEKFQLCFCCGFINCRVKEDYVSAKRDFEEFLEKCPSSVYPKARHLAKAYLAEIAVQLEKSSSQDI
jgi:uncharacterized membrane protein